jgi:hypothetical protein
VIPSKNLSWHITLKMLPTTYHSCNSYTSKLKTTKIRNGGLKIKMSEMLQLLGGGRRKENDNVLSHRRMFRSWPMSISRPGLLLEVVALLVSKVCWKMMGHGRDQISRWWPYDKQSPKFKHQQTSTMTMPSQYSTSILVLDSTAVKA